MKTARPRGPASTMIKNITTIVHSIINKYEHRIIFKWQKTSKNKTKTNKKKQRKERKNKLKHTQKSNKIT